MLQVTPFGSLPAVKVHLAPWGRRCVHPGWPQHHTTLPVPAHYRRRRGKQHPRPHHEHILGEGRLCCCIAVFFFLSGEWGMRKLHKYTSETLISFRMIGCILIQLRSGRRSIVFAWLDYAPGVPAPTKMPAEIPFGKRDANKYRKLTSPLKKVPFQKERSLPTTVSFLGDMLVLGVE